MSNHLYGFDISMEQTGITIFDLRTLKPIHITSVKTNEKHTHGMRLYTIASVVEELKNTYEPKVVAIERGFSRFNTSTQVIYRAHGLVNYLMRDYEQNYYPPKQVKEAIVRGDATKKFVQDIIQVAYPDIVFNNEDESDSFAVALTYLIKNKLLEWDKKKYKEMLKPKRKMKSKKET
ncbi:crossover junction endodeoxyribonuclease RuvC [Paenibacillus naphthalenovorans]|uniref:Crossover junction endodeoxyribonuclease RuvC n=1 Tax=Paenibacillus naphthalenovorans TaxID=162209 RepID=A0A0U2UJJ3_9BACL|nr:crossover junction endodeoxyribonuclease RuvC [Paenibacillus naphthalenovorans]ALS22081.1 crossover junction endodeoxyribonuclease RuvC [Paenibacillus naphthalenovorans]